MVVSQIEKMAFAIFLRSPLCEFARLVEPEVHHQAGLVNLFFVAEEYFYEDT